MKKYRLIALFFIICILLSSCNIGLEEPEEIEIETTVTLAGYVQYPSGSDNSGVSIVLEQSNGLRSTGSTCYSTTTDSYGYYSIPEVSPGNYTIYANSLKNTDRAVRVSVPVTSAIKITLTPIVLSPLGEIKGTIMIDGNESGNSGIIVFIEGTSFLAVTDDSGDFRFQGLPIDTTYRLYVQKGNYVDFLATVDLEGNVEEEKYILDSSLLSDSNSIVWAGIFDRASSITSPKKDYAYYNTTYKQSYIYDGRSWSVLSKSKSIKSQNYGGITLTGNVKIDGVADYSDVIVRVTTQGKDDIETITNGEGYFCLNGINAKKNHTIYFEKEGWGIHSYEIMANTYEPFSVVNFTEEHPVILYDTVAPIINNVSAKIGRITENGREVSLSIQGTDRGSGIKYIRTNTENTFENVSKQEFYNPYVVTIPDESGTKTIFVQVEDASGNVSQTVSTRVSIIKDENELYGILSDDKLHLVKEKSPYMMTNNVLVESDKTLIIDPGVEIQINGDYYFQVEGSLLAIGTEEDRINIYGIDKGTNNWSGIKLLANKGNTLSYVDISGLKEGIYGYGNVDHARISANGWAVGTDVYSYPNYEKDMLQGVLSDSEITGIVAIANSNVQRNIISGKRVDLYNTPFVIDNEISGDRISINSSNVESNIFSGKELSISYSYVLNSKIAVDSVKLSNNLQRYVTYNNCDVSISGGYSEIVFNNCSFSEFAATINNSNINDCGVITIDSSGLVIDCKGNYWGSTNTVELKSRGEDKNISFFIDYYDDFNLSRIDYSQYSEEEIKNIGYQGAGFGRKDSEKIYEIGDTGPAGGIVFFDKGFFSDGWRYLEVTQSSIGEYRFGYYRPNGNTVVGTISVIGSGKHNTERLVKYMDIEGMAYSDDLYKSEAKKEYAARICLDYSYGGYDDWFLPSIGELELVYNNLKRTGLASFEENTLLSSSEYGDKYVNYWGFYYNRSSYGSRGAIYQVRAVRAF